MLPTGWEYGRRHFVAVLGRWDLGLHVGYAPHHDPPHDHHCTVPHIMIHDLFPSPLPPLHCAGRTGRWKSKLLLLVCETLQGSGVLYSTAPEAPYPLAGPILAPGGLDLNSDPAAVGGPQIYYMSSKARTVFPAAAATAGGGAGSGAAAGLRFRGRQALAMAGSSGADARTGMVGPGGGAGAGGGATGPAVGAASAAAAASSNAAASQAFDGMVGTVVAMDMAGMVAL